jgi:hypothetical protein
MPIDYSKWDNLEVSSSEDEDDNEDDNTPRVTRLDAPSRVTFGGAGTNGAISASPEVAHTKSSSSSSELSKPRSKSKAPQASTATTSHPQSWTDRGGLLETKSKTTQNRNLYWSQDRYTVTLRLELPSDTNEKVRSVGVEGILPYSDRWMAVGTAKPRLSCVSANGEMLLEGELPHPVHLAEEDSDDGLVDWSVVGGNHNHNNEPGQHRFLTITLHKAVPMQGLSVWWRRPLMGFPEVDLDAVRSGTTNTSRDDHGLSSSSSSSSGTKGDTSKEFLEAWEEAHKIFREGKQKKTGQKPVI